MNNYAAENIRNIGLLAHGGAGKTSLTEALLFASKATTRAGRVEDGNTVTDFDPDEIRKNMSISLAIAPIEWNGTKVNVVDAPGYADFVGEVVSTLAVVDSALILIDATAGVEVGTEQVWQLSSERDIPLMIFVNRMDRENADFQSALESATNKFGNAVAPVQIPIGKEKDFRGLIDLVAQTAVLFTDDDDSGSPQQAEIPADMADDVATYRQKLLEAVAENDEDLMIRYLEDEDISDEELAAALSQCVKDGTVVPVFCGAATSLKGVSQLLDALVALAPAANLGSVSATVDGKESELAADPDGPLAALIFKTIADPHVGRLSYYRVYSGTIASNTTIRNENQNESERIGQVFAVRGKEHFNADSIAAGDIGAVGKLANSHTGDTICAEGESVLLETIEFPATSFSAAVNPHSKADLDKLGQALQRMVEEDPTLRIGRDTVTGETLLSGIGEPHVQIALERMTRRYNVNVDWSLPRVQYRETISSTATSEYKHKKQSGGAGQYGHVYLDLEPLSDADFEFDQRVVGGAVPRNFFPAVEKGIREALIAGPVAGYPVVSVKVTLFDGSYHDVDSNEMAFKIASKEAFKQGIMQGNPVILEPMLNIKVMVPDNFTGDVMSDLNGKRGQVSGMSPGENGAQTIEATVPAAEVQRYGTDLRSITQGRGGFTSEFSHYQPVPPHLTEQIKAESKERDAED